MATTGLAMLLTFGAGAHAASSQALGNEITPASKPVSVSQSAIHDAAAVTLSYATMAKIFADYEVEASTRALGMSTDAGVRAFAFRISKSHTEDAADLSIMLVQLGADGAPKTDPEHHALLDQLGRASLENFDRTFLEQQAESHKEALAMHVAYYSRGTSQTLAAFADKSATAARADLIEARKLLDALSAKDLQIVAP